MAHKAGLSHNLKPSVNSSWNRKNVHPASSPRPRFVISSSLTRAFGSQTASTSQKSVIDLNEFRRGVGLCVVNSQGLVFAARRMDDRQNTWQMPQGGIDPLENPLVAALRELREETGMNNVRIVGAIDHWLAYEYPTKVKADDSSWIRYRGQTQKWLLLHFHGDDGEIDISCHGTPEFSEWKWVRLQELPDNVVEFKKGVYQEVARHFCPRIDILTGEVRNNISPLL